MNARPTTGFLLQLSGPLQSWGERSRFNERDTATAPTRSGLIGMIAAALGRRRGESLNDLKELRFTVRMDRPGALLRDFHTVGGGMPPSLTVITAQGKRRKSESATVISHRYYLQDAAFTVAVTADDPALLDRCVQAVRAPVWPLYLGRRSCPPDPPLLLDVLQGDPIAALISFPIAQPAPDGQDTVQVEFRSDIPLDGAAWPDGPDAVAADQIYSYTQDEPVSFESDNRQFQIRPIYRRRLRLPARQCAGRGIDYLIAITKYLKSEQTSGSSPTSP